MSAAPPPGTPAAAGFRMPAEWELHAATWLAWPHNETDWPGKFAVIPPLFAALTRELARFERVRLIVASEVERDRARAELAKAGADVSRVDYLVAPTNRSWTRDYLPSFVVGPEGLGAVKWRFNGWSRYDDFEDDDAAGFRAAEFAGARLFTPTIAEGGEARRVVMEGGGLDVDGEGTVLLTEECLLTGPHARNPSLDRAVIETVMRDALAAPHVIWLTVGIEGDDTSGHVDDFARFVAPGRVVLCQEADLRDENYRVLGENRERLEAARDAKGRRLDVVPLPMPAPVVYEGQRLPASYANFSFVNGALLVPTFDDPMDGRALGILREVVPDREIVGVSCRDLVLGLGAIHCSTQQEPAVPDQR